MFVLAVVVGNCQKLSNYALFLLFCTLEVVDQIFAFSKTEIELEFELWNCFSNWLFWGGDLVGELLPETLSAFSDT